MQKLQREIKRRYSFKPVEELEKLEEDVWDMNPDKCKKKRFTKDNAKKVIKNAKILRKKYKGYKRYEKSLYYCNECHAYHVTSQLQ